jgi:hypothetical protein
VSYLYPQTSLSKTLVALWVEKCLVCPIALFLLSNRFELMQAGWSTSLPVRRDDFLRGLRIVVVQVTTKTELRHFP